MSSDGLLSRLVTRASVAGIDLSPSLATRLESYYRLLAHWNASINLTALQLDPITDHALDRLLIEPLVAARYISVTAPVPTWFDLGSGGGSPAIPLKLARPVCQIDDGGVERAEGRVSPRGDQDAWSWKNRTVEASRIEAVAGSHPLAGSVDLVTVRAVRIDPSLFGVHPLTAEVRRAGCPVRGEACGSVYSTRLRDRREFGRSRRQEPLTASSCWNRRAR